MMKEGSDEVVKNSFLVDCGATCHIVNDDSLFISHDSDFNPASHFLERADGSKSDNVALKKGTVELYLSDESGEIRPVHLEGALFVPSYSPEHIFCSSRCCKGCQG